MRQNVFKLTALIGFFLFMSTGVLAAQSAPAPVPNSSSAQKSSEAPNPSDAYYHFMLARRYQELAGIWNRGNYIEQAISEYKDAIQDDPKSLYLKVELAQLYWRVHLVNDAIKEAKGVLKVDPNYADAHRLLARIYWQSLGQSQPGSSTQQNLEKAIKHLEALTRIDPSDTESWLILGRLYRLDNQTAKAESAFKKVLAIDPDSRNALANLAQLYFDLGRYAEVVDSLKKIPMADMDSQLLSMLAYSYGKTRDFKDAISTYRQALSEDSGNQDIRRAYADTLLQKGDIVDARKELEKILKTDADNGAVYLRLAQIDRQQGWFDQARQELSKAKQLLPNDPEVPFEEAQLEGTLGNDGQAIQLLQGLIKKSERPAGHYTVAEANNRAIFLERLGLIYRGQQKYDQALATFKQILTLGKDQEPRGESLIIETLREDEQPKKAMEAANAAIKKFPNNQELVILRSMLLADQKKTDKAVAELRGLLKDVPADRDVFLNISQVYLQGKRYAEAEAAANKVLALSSDKDNRNAALFMLGSIYEREKKYDLAEQEFKKVLASDPLNAPAANYLGYMLAERGIRLEEAVKYIKMALHLDPNNGAYLDSLGWAYYRMNRYDLAEPHLEKAARLISNDPTIHAHLGHLYLAMGKKVQAEEEWERALKEWPHAVSSDFDSKQAAKLRKQLDELKVRLAKEKTAEDHR